MRVLLALVLLVLFAGAAAAVAAARQQRQMSLDDGDSPDYTERLDAVAEGAERLKRQLKAALDKAGTDKAIRLDVPADPADDPTAYKSGKKAALPENLHAAINDGAGSGGGEVEGMGTGTGIVDELQSEVGEPLDAKGTIRAPEQQHHHRKRKSASTISAKLKNKKSTKPKRGRKTGRRPGGAHWWEHDRRRKSYGKPKSQQGGAGAASKRREKAAGFGHGSGKQHRRHHQHKSSNVAGDQQQQQQLPSALSSEEARLLVDAHNEARSSENLPELVWDANLAHFAAQWAHHVKADFGCSPTALSDDQNKAGGENASRYPYSPLARDAEQVVGMPPRKTGENVLFLQHEAGEHVTGVEQAVRVVSEWMDERDAYDPDTGDCKGGKRCRDYVQVMWRKSKAVGCARASCGDAASFWVCEYTPPAHQSRSKPF